MKCKTATFSVWSRTLVSVHFKWYVVHTAQAYSQKWTASVEIFSVFFTFECRFFWSWCCYSACVFCMIMLKVWTRTEKKTEIEIFGVTEKDEDRDVQIARVSRKHFVVVVLFFPSITRWPKCVKFQASVKNTKNMQAIYINFEIVAWLLNTYSLNERLHLKHLLCWVRQK